MKRRLFLKYMGFSVASAPLLGMTGCKDDPPAKPKADVGSDKPTKSAPFEFRFWTEHEREILTAIIIRLLPADAESGAPSGAVVGVLEFLDRQMREPHFKDLERMMRAGVDFTDRVARKFENGPFVQQPPEIQDKILSQFQMGSVPKLKFPQQRFFATLMSFALEGYWGMPKYGGNRDKQVWAWVDINPHCSHVHGSCSE